MRINKYIAQATGLSRRAADKAISAGQVSINGKIPEIGQQVVTSDSVTLDMRPIKIESKSVTIMINKPKGFVCSRQGQGSRTIYDLLPERYHDLKPVGRLDKQTTGLMLLSNDGELANLLTHPRHQKKKIYQLELDKALQPLHQQMVNDHGIQLDDGLSQLILSKLDTAGLCWQVIMTQGRNRQIRRTFRALGYDVVKLHRTNFGAYSLGELAHGQIQEI